MLLPTFPAEIWRAILRLSVEIPESLDTKWDYSPDSLLWHAWESSKQERNREYYLALKTKLSVVQVSRTWREIGVELLYEHILFPDEEQEVEDVGVVFQPLAMVAAIFEQHPNGPGYGHATKRVDVPVTALSHSTLPILIHLLNFCHNLRVFIVFDSGVYRDLYYDAQGLSALASLLQTRFSHSLRRMTFNIPDIVNFRASYTSYHLPKVPLDSLDVGPYSFSPHDPPAAIATISALTLQTAYLSLQRMGLWHCPALRHLTLVHITDRCIESDLSFLISHGPQLDSLALLAFFVGTIKHPLSRLIALAPNLRCLVFDLIDIQHFSEKTFASITHVGICSKRVPSYFHPSLSPSIFPNLRCLRFLDISDQRPRWLLDIAQAFKHIRVEDKECQLLDSLRFHSESSYLIDVGQ